MMTLRCVFTAGGQEYEAFEIVPLTLTFLQFVMKHEEFDYVEIIDVQY